MPGVPQPIRVKTLNHRPLGGGNLELSAEAHTPAVRDQADDRKGNYFHSVGFQTPLRKKSVRSDQRLDLVTGSHDRQQPAIALVGEELPGGWDIKPEQLVHFLVGDEGAAFGRHHPVGHHLGTTLAVDVLGMPDEPEEPALETGFFAHLALRRLLVAFALFE